MDKHKNDSSFPWRAYHRLMMMVGRFNVAVSQPLSSQPSYYIRRKRALHAYVYLNKFAYAGSIHSTHALTLTLLILFRLWQLHLFSLHPLLAPSLSLFIQPCPLIGLFKTLISSSSICSIYNVYVVILYILNFIHVVLSNTQDAQPNNINNKTYMTLAITRPRTAANSNNYM